MPNHRLLPALLAVILPSLASAQGTITAGDVSFSRTDTPFDATPTATLTGASPVLAQNHLAAFGWWFRRVGLDTFEQPFLAPSSQTYVGDTSTMTWSGPVLNIVETARVFDRGSQGVGDGGEVEIVLYIKNVSASTRQLELFAMVNVDLDGADDDVAVDYLPPRVLSLSSGTTRAELYAGGVDAFLVRPVGANDVAAELNDANLDDFDSSGTPFGPGDFTGGFQWSLVLLPGAEVELPFVLAVDQSIFCDSGARSLYCNSFDEPPPLGWQAITPASCDGFCGDSSPAGCECDDGCVDRGDCCADACLTCGACIPF